MLSFPYLPKPTRPAASLGKRPCGASAHATATLPMEDGRLVFDQEAAGSSGGSAFRPAPPVLLMAAANGVLCRLRLPAPSDHDRGGQRPARGARAPFDAAFCRVSSAACLSSGGGQPAFPAVCSREGGLSRFVLGEGAGLPRGGQPAFLAACSQTAVSLSSLLI
jgi:hypothetical protein